MAAITVKAWSIGNSLRQARLNANILQEDVARMLKISREELTLFENGEVELPKHLMDTLFKMGLMMIHTRYMVRDYHYMTRQWRHMHTKAMAPHNKLKKIKMT